MELYGRINIMSQENMGLYKKVCHAWFWNFNKISTWYQKGCWLTSFKIQICEIRGPTDLNSSSIAPDSSNPNVPINLELSQPHQKEGNRVEREFQNWGKPSFPWFNRYATQKRAKAYEEAMLWLQQTTTALGRYSASWAVVWSSMMQADKGGVTLVAGQQLVEGCK